MTDDAVMLTASECPDPVGVEDSMQGAVKILLAHGHGAPQDINTVLLMAQLIELRTLNNGIAYLLLAIDEDDEPDHHPED